MSSHHFTVFSVAVATTPGGFQRQARELQLLNSREVRRGLLAPQRLEAAAKSGEWRLSLLDGIFLILVY